MALANNSFELILGDILTFLKPHFLYVKMGGSRCLPFIKNPSDYDIIIVSKDSAQRSLCAKVFRQKYDAIELHKIYKLDFHFISVDYESKFLINSIYPYFVLTTDILYSTIKDFMPKNITIKEFLQQKQAIIKVYKDTIPDIIKNDRFKNNHKLWYYMYTTLCIFKNQAFKFTNEQIDIINILHDRKVEDLELRKKLIDQIIIDINNA